MHDCIYTAHCMRPICDMACPVHAEISYWMNQCDLSMSNRIFRSSSSVIEDIKSIVVNHQGEVRSIFARDSVAVSDLISYCCIALYGQRKAFSNGIYNLNFSDYIDETKRSWQLKEEPESLEMVRIWINNAKYLIVSHLDYVNFKDFECQTLLRMMQDKEKSGNTMFVVLPKGDALIGSGQFFPRLTTKLKEVAIE